MAERRIPITRKQHDLVVRLIAAQTAAQQQLLASCDAILAGLPEEVPAAALRGASADNGVYTLNIDVPDDAAGG